MLGTELAVGERVRRRAGSAILASLAVVAVFAVVTVASKEIRTLNVVQPWQDDPYDVLVSLDFVVLPLLVAAGGLRVQLCRRYEPLSARRLVDLLRVCAAALGACLATEVAEWVAVALRGHYAVWTAVTVWQIAALAVLSAATIAVGVLLHRATRGVGRVAHASAQPDWLADAVALGMDASRLLGRYRRWVQTLGRWVDVQVIGSVRAHPLAAAALLAVVLTLPETAAKTVLEGYPPALVLLVFAISTASLFALLVVAGAYLRVVAPRPARRPVWLSATLVACTAATVAFAFHDSLLDHQTVATASALFFIPGLTAGAISFATLATFRRFHAHRQTS